MGRPSGGDIWLKLVRAATAVALAFSMGVAAAPPAHAAFPGANGRIVFDDVVAFWNGQAPASNLFSIRPDGTGQKQLTDHPDGVAALRPMVSPDGHHVVYTAHP